MSVDLFHLFRRLLLIVGLSYTAVRLLNVLYTWRIWGLSAGRSESLVRRWLMASLLRTRLRRFTGDVLQIALLLLLLTYLIWVQA